MQKGRFSAPHRPSRTWPAGFLPGSRGAACILLMVLGTVFCVCAIGLALCLIHLSSARRNFQSLSQAVQEYVPEVTAPPKVPATDPQAPEAQPEALVPRETEQAEAEMLPQYAALYARNPDLFGWLRIEGTAIDYPVMYSPGDPERYLHANFAGDYSFSGVPFVDGSCTADSDNLIIYGHNMLDGSMFRSLLDYQYKAFWQEHPTIAFDTLYEQGEYEVLASFYDRVYYEYETNFKFYRFIDAKDPADFDNAMENFQKKRIYDTGVTASYGDRLITLVTCAYHTQNGRFVVVARKK